MGLSSASRANFALGSGSFPNVELLTPRVDPIERAVIFSATAPLEKNTQYNLQIHSGGGTNALVAFDGAEFEGSTLIVFTTADDDDVTVEDADTPLPTKQDHDRLACHAYSILSNPSNCTGTYCHGGGDYFEAGNTQPVMGLSFFFPAAGADPIQLTAVGHPSVEAQDPSNVGGTPTLQPRNFPVGMAIVEPGASAASYLMYKILMRYPTPGSSPAAAYMDPTVPDLPHPGETTADDLATRMFGQPMPDPQRATEPNGGPNHTVEWSDRAILRRWIDDGAQACPCARIDENTYGCKGAPGSDAGADAGDADATAETGDAGADADASAGD